MTRCVSIERHHWLIPATLSSLPEYPKRAAGSLLILRLCVFLCACAPLRLCENFFDSLKIFSQRRRGRRKDAREQLKREGPSQRETRSGLTHYRYGTQLGSARPGRGMVRSVRPESWSLGRHNSLVRCRQGKPAEPSDRDCEALRQPRPP